MISPQIAGFVTNIESDLTRGLSERRPRLISKEQAEFHAQFRLGLPRWQKMTEPTWLVSSIPLLITRTSFTRAEAEAKAE